MNLFFVLCALLSSLVTSKKGSTSENYYLIDNCVDQADGEYYMKLISDDDAEDTTFPIVKVKCQNEFIIIDVDYDENLKEYFTSWAMWHTSIAGPDNSDVVDWTSWFVKSRQDPENAKFLLSPDCSTCEEDHVRQHFDYKSTYWMSGNLFGCMWMILGKHNCDLDATTYACYDCSQSSDPMANGDAIEITEESDPSAYYYTGQCATAIRASDSEVTSSHDTCQMGLHWSFGMDEGDLYELQYETNLVTTTHSVASDVLEDTSDASDDDSEISEEVTKDVKHGRSLRSITSSIWNSDQFAGEIFKPSLGTDGRFCVCSQAPSTQMVAVTKKELLAAMEPFGDDIDTFHQFSSYAIETDAREKKPFDVNAGAREERLKEKIKTSENLRVELWAHHFEHGTFRIKESGTYVIMEDIEFNFNAGSLDDPQASGAWKPFGSQVEEYPGAESGRDEYFLGFFAGITIECDDVILDLNGFSIGMSEVFYHQQRWFTTISLTSQFFLPGNGPGFFGYNPRSATNVLIKDGTIGLSSHFGIHGNYNSDVTIDNVHIRDFEVHGIQFNGFERLHLKDVEVGPSSTKAFFTGEYGHMRYVLDRLNKAIEELGEEAEDAAMEFVNRESESLYDLAARTERMMNYAFDYVVNAKELSEDDFEDDSEYEEYVDAIDIFVNPSGIPYASVLHGIFLNTKEASVMTYNLYTTTYSETAVLENVKIHDLTHAMDERVRMYNDIYMFFGPFLNCLNARQLLGDEVVDDADSRSYFGQEEIPFQYHGSIVTDVYLALTKYSNNWDYLEKMLTGAHVLVPWSEGETSLPPSTNIACNMDVMIHSGKGTTGLRLDGVKDIKVTNLEVYNLHDKTPSGQTVCGEYSGFSTVEGGGHLAQQMPMQEGFSGNKVQGVTLNSAVDTVIDGIKMYNLESDTGPIMGVALWPANDVNIGGELYFADIKPSTSLDFEAGDEAVTGLYPNQDHFGCAIYLYENYVNGPSSYGTDLVFDESATLEACGIDNDRTGVDAVDSCYRFDSSLGLAGKMSGLNEAHKTFVSRANLQSDACETEEAEEAQAQEVAAKEEVQQVEEAPEQAAEAVKPEPEEDMRASQGQQNLEKEEVVETVSGKMHSHSHGAASDWDTMKLLGVGAVVLVVAGLTYRWVTRKETKVSFVGETSNYGTLRV